MSETPVIPPADDAVMVMGDAPVSNPEFPFFVYNAHRLPELLTAFSQAQGEYGKIVRDKEVVQRLKDRESGNYDGREIRFMYAELSSILDAVIPSLSKYGLSFAQPIQQTEEGTYLLTMLAHKAGCVMISRIKLAGGEMKAFGAEITYIRRYMAGPMLGVSAEDDSDEDGTTAGEGDGNQYGGRSETAARPAPSTGSRKPPERRSAAAGEQVQGAAAKVEKVSPGQLANLRAKITALTLDAEAEAAMLQRLEVPAIDMNMTVEQWKKVRAELDRMAGS